MHFLKKALSYGSSLLILGALIHFSSCAPANSCDTLVCQNGGTCAADFCNCPTGYDGPQCENKITDRYVGTYAGWTSPYDGFTHHIDTVDVYASDFPLTLTIVKRRFPDTKYIGKIDAKTNTVIIDNIVNGSTTKVISVTIKAPTVTEAAKTLKLEEVFYEGSSKLRSIEFNGTWVKY